MIDLQVPIVLLAYGALIYLAATTVILFRNRNHVGGLIDQNIPAKNKDNRGRKISICIPARNEELTIEQCVSSACQQTYAHCEVLVLDDESDDATPEKLSTLSKQFPEILTIFKGRKKPEHWLGKNWACHQLFSKSNGNIVVFIDADTFLDNHFANKVVDTLLRENLDFATVWPQQQMKSFWEKLLIPMVYHTLLSTLPAHYVSKKPWWIPSRLARKTAPLFAAACGQCMIFERYAYIECGGHEQVKNEIVEDVAIAKNVKKAGLIMKMYHGIKSITCRMYHSESEIRNGFRKNFLAGFGYNIPLFLAVSFLHWIVFIFPYIWVIVAIITSNYYLVTVALMCCMLIYIQRFYVDTWFDWQKTYSLLHPVGVLWYQYLAVLTLADYIGNRTVTWKERAT